VFVIIRIDSLSLVQSKITQVKAFKEFHYINAVVELHNNFGFPAPQYRQMQMV